VRSPAAEVVEDWTALARELIKKWSDYGAYVSTRLDQGWYDSADKATTDLAGGVSLSIETAAKLAWEWLDSFTILSEGVRREIVDSQEFTVAVPNAHLALAGDLTSGFSQSITADAVHFFALPFPDKTRFKLRVDATGCSAGTYSGTVLASPPGNQAGVPVQPVQVQVWITVP